MKGTVARIRCGGSTTTHVAPTPSQADRIGELLNHRSSGDEPDECVAAVDDRHEVLLKRAREQFFHLGVDADGSDSNTTWQLLKGESLNVGQRLPRSPSDFAQEVDVAEGASAVSGRQPELSDEQVDGERNVLRHTDAEGQSSSFSGAARSHWQLGLFGRSRQLMR